MTGRTDPYAHASRSVGNYTRRSAKPVGPFPLRAVSLTPRPSPDALSAGTCCHCTIGPETPSPGHGPAAPAPCTLPSPLRTAARTTSDNLDRLLHRRSEPRCGKSRPATGACGHSTRPANWWPRALWTSAYCWTSAYIAPRARARRPTTAAPGRTGDRRWLPHRHLRPRPRPPPPEHRPMGRQDRRLSLVAICDLTELEVLYSARSATDRTCLKAALDARYAWCPMPDGVYRRSRIT